jgi:23S rRNA (pseudouridine1915-N3)-methyltransferase
LKRVLLLAEGRLKDSGLRALLDDYYRRCSHRFRVEEREARDLTALKRALPERGLVVALDERGRQHRSVDFARLLEGWLERAPLTLVIGGADGLDDDVRERADHLLSLSKMTLAHRLVRLVLAEQLYRAVSILDGAPYHRE